MAADRRELCELRHSIFLLGKLASWGFAEGAWNKQTVAELGVGLNPPSGPATAWTGSAVVVAAVDSSGNLNYWWRAEDTGAWNKQTVASGPNAATPSGTVGVKYLQPAIAWTGGAVVITAADNSGNLYYWWQAEDTAAWNPQLVAAYPGTTSATGAYASPAIVWTGSDMIIAAVDNLWMVEGPGA